MRPSAAATAAERPQLPLAARGLIAAAFLAALAASVAARPQFSGIDWLGLALLAVLATASERFSIGLYGESHISIAFVFLLAAAMEYGAAGVLVVAPLTALAGHPFSSRPLNKLVYNASVTTLGGLAASGALHGVNRVLSGAPEAAVVIPALLAACVNYLVTAALVAWIIGISSGDNPWHVWSEKYLWLLPHYLALGVFGFIVAFGYRELGVPGLLVMTTPPLLIRYAMKQYIDHTTETVTALKSANAELRDANTQISAMSKELEDGYQETLQALVSALDVRDSEVHGHSVRVVELSLRIAARLGIRPESEAWHDLKHGALLHDVGKIGVPDSILRKPGKLTPEEWEVMRHHTAKGYAMLRDIHFLRGAAEVAYCHHERYDGSGYPRGLACEQIPLIVRIFAVADAIDAMTSVRPYHTPVTFADACREIVRCSGTQFDPQVVEAFVSVAQLAPAPAALSRAA